MSKRMIAAAVVAAALLSGCTTPTSDRSNPARERTTSAAWAVPPATPAGPAAPFAKVVAKYEKTWQDYAAGVDACDKAAAARTADDIVKAMNCVKGAQAATQAARAATEELTALKQPPTEIQALLARTLAALTTLRNAGAETACQDAASDPCAQAVDNIDQALSPLVDILDSWNAYINP